LTGQRSVLPTFLVGYRNKKAEYRKDTHNKLFMLKVQEEGDRKMRERTIKEEGARRGRRESKEAVGD
jgi:hypothetical protein